MPVFNHLVGRSSFLPEHQVATPLFESGPPIKAGTQFAVPVRREKAG